MPGQHHGKIHEINRGNGWKKVTRKVYAKERKKGTMTRYTDTRPKPQKNRERSKSPARREQEPSRRSRSPIRTSAAIDNSAEEIIPLNVSEDPAVGDHWALLHLDTTNGDWYIYNAALGKDLGARYAATNVLQGILQYWDINVDPTREPIIIRFGD
ncbi:hypothetical protein BP6252_12571 [Coleophoma cylindrospora]|uniref:Uncharacterized protein n=1 Tax=Coleophoma cylindrospora TaxID=1849047 RepID=A0A3D8QDH8_9HELO|nr:hypothetical protein BP6252_12571 [Coleophoma cylindrospora]